MTRNMTVSLIEHERIITTIQKAIYDGQISHITSSKQHDFLLTSKLRQRLF